MKNAKEMNAIIGKRVMELRVDLGMTQEELAEKVGYTSASSRTNINKIEQGKNGIPASKILLFAKALNTTETYLMCWAEEDERQQAEQLWEAYQSAPENVKEAVRLILKMDEEVELKKEA